MSSPGKRSDPQLRPQESSWAAWGHRSCPGRSQPWTPGRIPRVPQSASPVGAGSGTATAFQENGCSSDLIGSRLGCSRPASLVPSAPKRLRCGCCVHWSCFGSARCLLVLILTCGTWDVSVETQLFRWVSRSLFAAESVLILQQLRVDVQRGGPQNSLLRKACAFARTRPDVRHLPSAPRWPQGTCRDPFSTAPSSAGTR